ncbi:MAG: polysaccharide biosynthesis C-terminal domain-containing protein [Phycisphaerae bacterium]|nr:polysaccharide biosynthesis C-terminal domain-containing protein [Phycisphaerae bacterium]
MKSQSGILRSVSWYFIAAFGERLCSFLIIPLITQPGYINPVGFGAIELLVFTTLLLAGVFQGPLLSAVSRFFYHPDYTERRGQLLFGILCILLVYTGLIALLFWFYAEPINRLMFRGQDYVSVIQWFAAMILLDPLLGLLNQYMFLRVLPKSFAFISIARGVGILAATFLLLPGMENKLLGLIQIRVIVTAASCIPLLAILLPQLKPTWGLRFLAHPLHFGYRGLMDCYSSIMIQSGDRYLLQWLAPEGSVGVYSLGYRVATPIQFLTQTVIKQAIIPRFLRMESQRPILESLLSVCSLLFYSTWMIIVVGLACYSETIIHLLAKTPSYYPASGVLPLIAFSYLLHGLLYFAGFGIVLEKKSHLLSISAVLAAVGNVLLNLWFIPIWGIIGAAVATVITYLLWNGMRLLYSSRLSGIRYPILPLVLISLLGMAAWGIAEGVAYLWPSWQVLFRSSGIVFYAVAAYPFARNAWRKANTLRNELQEQTLQDASKRGDINTLYSSSVEE